MSCLKDISADGHSVGCSAIHGACEDLRTRLNSAWAELHAADAENDELRQQVEQLRDTLQMADRLLSFQFFDAPEDLAELNMIAAALAATEEE